MELSDKSTQIITIQFALLQDVLCHPNLFKRLPELLLFIFADVRSVPFAQNELSLVLGHELKFFVVLGDALQLGLEFSVSC